MKNLFSTILPLGAMVCLVMLMCAPFVLADVAQKHCKSALLLRIPVEAKEAQNVRLEFFYMPENPSLQKGWHGPYPTIPWDEVHHSSADSIIAVALTNMQSGRSSQLVTMHVSRRWLQTSCRG